MAGSQVVTPLTKTKMVLSQCYFLTSSNFSSKSNHDSGLDIILVVDWSLLTIIIKEVTVVKTDVYQ